MLVLLSVLSSLRALSKDTHRRYYVRVVLCGWPLRAFYMYTFIVVGVLVRSCLYGLFIWSLPNRLGQISIN